MEGTQEEPGGMFFIEHPMLDIIVYVDDDSIIEKYGMQKGLACVADPSHLPMFDEPIRS